MNWLAVVAKYVLESTEPSALRNWLEVPPDFTSDVPVTTLAAKLPLASRDTRVLPVLVLSALSPSTRSAFRLDTFVVDVTVNGAVPVATVEVRVGADTPLYAVRTPAPLRVRMLVVPAYHL